MPHDDDPGTGPAAGGFAARVGLVVALAVGSWLRISGLGWGVPRFDPDLARGTVHRMSFHPDEDKILWELAAMQPSSLDLHPTVFQWGTLPTYTAGLALAVGRSAGLVPHDWRGALREGRDLRRLYVAGRAVSALFGILTLPVVYLLARLRGGETAGVFSTGLLALSPLHVLHSHFLTPDVALAFWLVLSVWCLERSWPVRSGLCAGLALATKASAVFLLPLFMAAHFFRRPRRWWLAYPAIAAGFLIGEPYALLEAGRWARSVFYFVGQNAIGMGPSAPMRILGGHAVDLTLYALGPVALLLAILGLARVRGLLAGAAALLFASMLSSRVPVSRYELPLVPILAVGAGIALGALRPTVRVTGALLALLPPAILCIAQAGVLRDTHTAQSAADWMATEVPTGSAIAQIWSEYPLLDGRRWRVRTLEDPFGLEGHPYRPLQDDVVVIDDTPVAPLRPELRADLDRRYAIAASFVRPPRLLGVSLPEPLAPHDWKYSHPRLWIFRRTGGEP